MFVRTLTDTQEIDMTIQEILEEDRKVSSFEDGVEEGRRRVLAKLQKYAIVQLKNKYCKVPKALANQIKTIKDIAMLGKILYLLGGAESLEDAERHVNAVLATA
jgi:hypothetical protein